jgi:hypothetical protein
MVLGFRWKQEIINNSQVSIGLIKVKNVIFAIILSLLLSQFTCIPREDSNCHRHLSFINNSNKTLVVDPSYDVSDTILPLGSPLYAKDFKIEPFANSSIMNINICWEDNWSGLDPLKKWSIFLFDYDTIVKYGWDSVRLRYSIEKRFDLSLNDLRTKNWQLVYP